MTRVTKVPFAGVSNSSDNASHIRPQPSWVESSTIAPRPIPAPAYEPTANQHHQQQISTTMNHYGLPQASFHHHPMAHNHTHPGAHVDPNPNTPDSLASPESSGSSTGLSSHESDTNLRPARSRHDSLHSFYSSPSSTNSEHTVVPGWSPSLSRPPHLRYQAREPWSSNGVSNPLVSRRHGPEEPYPDQSDYQHYDHAFVPGEAVPHGLKHMAEFGSSWSLFDPLEKSKSEDFFESGPDTNVLQTAPNFDQQPRSVSEYNRQGRRSGPLSSQTRENANSVRTIGSCLRCFVMREPCDTGTPKCQNCIHKHPRSWKFTYCVRPRLPQRFRYLIPEAFEIRLQKNYVRHFIDNRGWRVIDAKPFQLLLDIGLTDALDVPVREYLPNVNAQKYRPAFVCEQSEDSARAREVQQYDLPVVLSCYDEHKAANGIRHKLSQWFLDNIQKLNSTESHWGSRWFDAEHDVFQRDVLDTICKYYRADLVGPHEILRNALALSFFNYIMSHGFEVPHEDLPRVISSMQCPPDPGMEDLQYVAPSTLNYYIKMLLLVPLRDVAHRTLKDLESLLLQTTDVQCRRDLIFAAGFIVVAHIGKTQVSLLQLAEQPDPQETLAVPRFRKADAVEAALAMENECAQVIIDYLRQFLVRSERKKATSGSSKTRKVKKGEAEAEEHANEFGFMHQIAMIREEYAHTMPQNLELDASDVSTFVAVNTNRICWKYVEAVLAELH